MILITGGNGQLGTELRHLLDERGVSYTAADVNELDITDKNAVETFFDQHKPEIVYHCAAYTAVDKAEDEGATLNTEINVDGTRNIAQSASKIGAIVIYISTDYVFSGNKNLGEEWEVDDIPHPQSNYGIAKLAGEEEVRHSGAPHYIVRTSWAFGSYGNNFVFTMQRLAKNNKVISVVDDQHGRPTWTRTLAEFMTYIVDNHAEYGTYHLTNDTDPGEDVTWYDFAKKILKGNEVKIHHINSTSLESKARRPYNSVLSLTKAKQLGFKIPKWQDALAEMLKLGDLR